MSGVCPVCVDVYWKSVERLSGRVPYVCRTCAVKEKLNQKDFKQFPDVLVWMVCGCEWKEMLKMEEMA